MRIKYLVISMSLLIVATASLQATTTRTTAGARRATIPPSWLLTIAQVQRYNFDSQWWTAGQTMAPRKNFVQDLIGMDEATFRHKVRWNLHDLFDPAQVKGNWIKDYQDQDGYYRRAAIYQGTVVSYTTSQWWKKAKQAKLPIRGKGYFSILFDDPALLA